MKDRLLQDAKIALLGILAIALIVLTVLELIPNESVGLEVKETARVSSASLSPIDAEVKDYQTAVTGMLSNPTDETVKVDSVNVKISDGESTRDVVIEGFEIPARSYREFSSGFEGQIAYDRVTEVAVTVGSVRDVLPNQTESRSPISGVAVFYLALLVPVAWLLVRAVKGRYYLHQEMANKESIL